MKLTSREMEVVRRVALDLPNKAIAAELGISMKTVEHHRSAANRKIGCHSPIATALWAWRNGLMGLVEGENGDTLKGGHRTASGHRTPPGYDASWHNREIARLLV